MLGPGVYPGVRGRGKGQSTWLRKGNSNGLYSYLAATYATLRPIQSLEGEIGER
jgi:hypothetical protein